MHSKTTSRRSNNGQVWWEPAGCMACWDLVLASHEQRLLSAARFATYCYVWKAAGAPLYIVAAIFELLDLLCGAPVTILTRLRVFRIT